MTRFYFVFSFFPKTASISFFGFLAVVSCYGKKGAAKVRRGVKKKKWKKKKKKKRAQWKHAVSMYKYLFIAARK